MNIQQLLEFANNDVISGNTKLHKLYIKEVQSLIKKHNIEELRLCELNSYYISEKEYFGFIVKNLESIMNTTKN
jgi:hypothetical protein